MKRFWLGFVTGILSVSLLMIAAVLVADHRPARKARALRAPELDNLRGSLNFEYQSLKGEKGSLANLRGKVVFVNFWSTTCGPCKTEMPFIQKLYDRYKGDPSVEFLVVALEEPAEVSPVAERLHTSLPFYTASEKALTGPLDISVYPTTFIVAKDGTLATKHVGSADWSADSVQEFINGLRKEDVTAR